MKIKCETNIELFLDKDELKTFGNMLYEMAFHLHEHVIDDSGQKFKEMAEDLYVAVTGA
jgi:hypothetical protein